MQTIYARELYGIPLYFREDPDIVPKWLAGYEPTGKEIVGDVFRRGLAVRFEEQVIGAIRNGDQAHRPNLAAKTEWFGQIKLLKRGVSQQRGRKRDEVGTTPTPRR